MVPPLQTPTEESSQPASRIQLKRLCTNLLIGMALVGVVVLLHARTLPVGASPVWALKWDSVQFSYPYAAFLNRCLHLGRAPLWNPFSFGGAPFFGNLQNMALHPPTLLAAVLMELTEARFQVLELFQIVLGALGMYLWGSARTGSRFAGFVGGLLFAGCGIVINFYSHFIQLALYCALPYPFAWFQRWSRSGKVSQLILCGLSLSTWLVTSYPSQLGYYLITFVLFYGFRRIPSLGTNRGRRVVACELLIVCVVPLLLTAVHLWPAVKLIPLMGRAGGVPLAATFRQSMHPTQLFSILLGFLATAPTTFLTPDQTLRAYTIGITGCVLVVYALLRPNRSRLLVFGGALLCIDLVLGPRSMLLGPLHRISPLTANSLHPTVEFGTLLSFALLTLVMDGAADFKLRFEPRRFVGALVIVAVALAFFQLVSDGFAPARLDQESWRQHSLWMPGRVLFLLGLAGVARSLRWRAQTTVAATLVFFAAGLDSWISLRDNQRLLYNPVAKDYFAGQARRYRAAEQGYFAGYMAHPRRTQYPYLSNEPMILGERTDWGYDSAVLRLQAEAMAKPAVRTVLLQPAPAFLADEVVVTADAARVPFLQEGHRVAAVLPGTIVVPSASGGSGVIPAAHGTIEATPLGPNRILYRARCEASCFVVFNELALPGWTLKIDGTPRPLVVANGFFRATFLDVGTHQLELSYLPPGLIPGLVCSGLGLALLVSLLVLARQGRFCPRLQM